MLKAIKCRACGEVHWGLCAGAGDFVANKTANTPILDVIEKVAPLILLDKCSDSRHLYKEESRASSTYKYRDAEKRRAYQREYMRKRRAEKINS